MVFLSFAFHAGHKSCKIRPTNCAWRNDFTSLLRENVEENKLKLKRIRYFWAGSKVCVNWKCM